MAVFNDLPVELFSAIASYLPPCCLLRLALVAKKAHGSTSSHLYSCKNPLTNARSLSLLPKKSYSSLQTMTTKSIELHRPDKYTLQLVQMDRVEQTISSIGRLLTDELAFGVAKRNEIEINISS